MRPNPIVCKRAPQRDWHTSVRPLRQQPRRRRLRGRPPAPERRCFPLVSANHFCGGMPIPLSPDVVAREARAAVRVSSERDSDSRRTTSQDDSESRGSCQRRRHLSRGNCRSSSRASASMMTRIYQLGVAQARTQARIVPRCLSIKIECCAVPTVELLIGSPTTLSVGCSSPHCPVAVRDSTWTRLPPVEKNNIFQFTPTRMGAASRPSAPEHDQSMSAVCESLGGEDGCCFFGAGVEFQKKCLCYFGRFMSAASARDIKA